MKLNKSKKNIYYKLLERIQFSLKTNNCISNCIFITSRKPLYYRAFSSFFQGMGLGK